MPINNKLDGSVRMNRNGRIVIPAAMRTALGVKPGDELLLHFQDGELRLSTRLLRIQRAQQMVHRALGANPDLVDGFIAERRRAARYE